MQFYLFVFFFAVKSTQHWKISYTTNNFRVNCSDREIHIYKVKAECRRLNNIPDFEATLLK